MVNHGSGTIAYNSYFPMPFRKRARVTRENTGTNRVEMFWYHIELKFECVGKNDQATRHFLAADGFLLKLAK